MTRLSVCLLFCAVVSYAADTLIGGPYTVNVGKNSATVCAVVQGADVKLSGDPAASAQSLRSQCVDFKDLKPGATYSYELAGVEGGKGSFKTPPVGEASFSFIVYGDTRSRHELHQKVVDAMVKVNPEFVVHTGDLVVDGRDTKQWPIFFNIEKELLRNTVFFPALGNHERNNPQYYRFFDLRKGYYSFDWGAAHFVVLDSDLGNIGDAAAKEKFWAEQRRWMEDDLAKAQGAALRFAIFHHPPFTAVKKRQDSGNAEVQALVPLFEKYKITAVFNGHDHNYQHHLKNGIHYIVTGGGGAPLYPVDAPIEGTTKKLESTEHFVQIRVDGRTAHVEAIALDGHKIDTIELK